MGALGIGTIQTNPGTSPRKGVDTENVVETIINHGMIINHRITTGVKEVTVEAAMTTEPGKNQTTGNHTEINVHDTIARIDIQTIPARTSVDKMITTKALGIGIVQRTGVTMIEEDNVMTVEGEHHSEMHAAQSHNLRQ